MYVNVAVFLIEHIVLVAYSIPCCQSAKDYKNILSINTNYSDADIVLASGS